MPRQDILKGIRVVDFSRAYSGPFGAQLLGDLGAEIIKIEVPGIGDFSRNMNPYLIPGQSYTIQALNRNKKSVTLSTSTKLGRQAFHDLVKISDVVYGNVRYNALERMGADYKTLKKINPRIILCNISGWGSAGPYAEYPSYDDNLLALSGISSLCSPDSEGRPTRSPIAIADLAGGIFSTNGILAALYQRERTGVGCEVKMAIVDCCLSLLSVHFQSYFISGKVPKASGTRHPIGGISGAFKTRNGLIVLAPCWPGIAKVTHREDLYTDPRFDTTPKRATNHIELCSILEQELMKQDTEYWLEIMHKEDIPVSKLNTVDSVLDDPQVKYNQAIIELEHPAYGKMRAVECPLHFEGAPQSKHTPPPTMGQDNDEVLKNILHYSDAQIKAIRDEEQSSSEQLKKRIKSQF